MSLLSEALILCHVLASKDYLNDDERSTYSALNTYIALQIRAATSLLKRDLLEQGLTNDELEGFVTV